MEADFVPVARALAARGLALRIASLAGGRGALVKAGNAVILWQAVDDPGARVLALERGIHDVVGPWMDPQEATARIVRLAMAPFEPARLQVGDLEFALIDRTVARAGRSIPLLAREYALLLYLARRPGEAVSRRSLLEAVWRIDFDPGTNSVEVHVSRLRAKLDRDFEWPMLRTLKGQGYLLQPRPAGDDQF